MGEGLGRKTHCNNNKKKQQTKKTKTINNNKQQRKRNERNPELDAYRYIYTFIHTYIYNTILYYTILYRHGGLFHCFLTGSPSSRFYYQPTSLPLPSPPHKSSCIFAPAQGFYYFCFVLVCHSCHLGQFSVMVGEPR